MENEDIDTNLLLSLMLRFILWTASGQPARVSEVLLGLVVFLDVVVPNLDQGRGQEELVQLDRALRLVGRKVRTVKS